MLQCIGILSGFWKELVRLAFGISRVVQLVGDRIVEINLTGAKESQEFIRRGAGYSNERISFSFLHSLEPTIH